MGSESMSCGSSSSKGSPTKPGQIVRGFFLDTAERIEVDDAISCRSEKLKK